MVQAFAEGFIPKVIISDLWHHVILSTGKRRAGRAISSWAAMSCSSRVPARWVSAMTA
jgi:hypothetical protein